MDGLRSVRLTTVVASHYDYTANVVPNQIDYYANRVPIVLTTLSVVTMIHRKRRAKKSRVAG